MMPMRTGSNEQWGWTAVGALGAAVVLLAVLLVPAESFAQGCAMCATYLANGTDPRADAFKVSIMFLMAMPFLVVGCAGGWIAWMYRRSRLNRPELRLLRAEGEGVS
jgi:hypothetical protein